ncbi:MAG TPA: LLM class flavin-dependent oxidoreductase [Actinomycetota bacterium]|nr:LLM class flavin-dependent oxidoreductase [Actinomycetota bacterium]
MQVGIGLPNTVPGSTGSSLLEWARRADRAGFSSLATIGAVSYPCFEELTSFAAAGAVTERIRFFSNILVAPARSSAELAKQSATVDQLTGGRLTLGMGVGWRTTDFQLTGRDYKRRGRAFDQQLADLQKSWSGEPILEGTREVGPPLVQQPGIPILIGGTDDASFRRAAKYGVGWTAGGLPPDAVIANRARAEAAWQQAGRADQPRVVALIYFGLGDTQQASYDYLIDYYKAGGMEFAEMVAGSPPRSAEALAGAIGAYAATGIDELILDPTFADPDQVDLCAEVVFNHPAVG